MSKGQEFQHTNTKFTLYFIVIYCFILLNSTLNAKLNCATWYCTSLYYSSQHRTLLYWINYSTLYCTVINVNELYSMVLYSNVLHCFTVHYTPLYTLHNCTTILFTVLYWHCPAGLNNEHNLSDCLQITEHRSLAHTAFTLCLYSIILYCIIL